MNLFQSQEAMLLLEGIEKAAKRAEEVSANVNIWWSEGEILVGEDVNDTPADILKVIGYVTPDGEFYFVETIHEHRQEPDRADDPACTKPRGSLPLEQSAHDADLTSAALFDKEATPYVRVSPRRIRRRCYRDRPGRGS